MARAEPSAGSALIRLCMLSVTGRFTRSEPAEFRGYQRGSEMKESGLHYRNAGVDDEAESAGLKALADRVRRTFKLAGEAGAPGSVLLDLGYFANVVQVAPGLGIAVSTDGVGTKLLVAEMLGKYDTIGIDCVAMNVNDVLCVGARPITLLDYIAVERADPTILAAVADGLLRGAEQAGVSIAGGELAQLGGMLRGARPGSGFDIVGTAVGLVPLDRIIVGDGLTEGDLIIGLRSTGIHSNGLTLARRALFERAGYQPTEHIEELGRSVGEELLEPTRIYVRPILALLEAVTEVKALAHITGDGLLNLLRVTSPVGFEVSDLPDPPAIFQLIQRSGSVDDPEMFRVFNMGVGFCVIVSSAAVDDALKVLEESGVPDAAVIGRVSTHYPGEIRIPSRALVGTRAKGFWRI